MLEWASRRPGLLHGIGRALAPRPLPVSAFGLDFPNPVGLAAGMDKGAVAVPAWEALGFGFSELGGITQLPQPGNPRPRMFRVVDDEALINRMGFNNPGAEAMANTLRQWHETGHWPSHPIGINLGKSKATPLEKAAEDYLDSFRRLKMLADFFVVNVSSPNTPNLRKLQDKAALDEILESLQAENRSANPARKRLAADEVGTPRPILVKVAPDLSWNALDEILELTESRQVAGLVATNTTLQRPECVDSERTRIYSKQGGLSGRPLASRSTDIIRHLFRQSRGQVPIIGVGGIFTAEDAWEKITAGATLLQVYTGLVYEGPSITRAIVNGLCERLDREGFSSLEEAVGIAQSD